MTTIERAPGIDFNLLDALQRINWNYGRGDIRAYRLDPDNGSRTVTGVAYRRIPMAQRTSVTCAIIREERRFRVIGQTVHFLGHQRRLP